MAVETHNTRRWWACSSFPTVKYLVAKGGNPKVAAKDGTSVIDKLKTGMHYLASNSPRFKSVLAKPGSSPTKANANMVLCLQGPS